MLGGCPGVGGLSWCWGVVLVLGGCPGVGGLSWCWGVVLVFCLFQVDNVDD